MDGPPTHWLPGKNKAQVDELDDLEYRLPCAPRDNGRRIDEA